MIYTLLKGTSVTLFILALGCYAYAQHDPSNTVVPKLTSPSPNAYSLGKYGDIPVSEYTGVPSIQIPLYTIETKTIEIPIEISYHASGIKAREEASSVGLGWSLNAGGVITQSIIDADDFRSAHIPIPIGYSAWSLKNLINSFPEYSGVPCIMDHEPTNSTNLYFGLWGPANEAVDLEPDIFSFNFLGYSGKFIYDKTAQKIIVLDQQNIKFKLSHDSNTLTQNRHWTVLLPDGTELTFAATELVEHSYTSKIRSISWYLTKVLTTRGEEISFTYKKSGTPSQMIPSMYQKEVKINTIASWPEIEPDNLPTYQYDYNVQYYPCYLTSISFDHGEVKLLYDDSRQDIHRGERISSVTVSSGSQKIREYIFDNNSYFTGFDSNHSIPTNIRNAGLTENHFSYRLKLNGIHETVSNAKYAFKYNPRSLPYKDSYCVDHWGYPHGRYGATTLAPDIKKVYATNDILPDILNYYSHFTVADRSADVEAIKSAVLEEIQFPTGGTTKFEYEANSFYNYSAITPRDNEGSRGGGLRVKRIVNTGRDGNTKIKRYHYRKNSYFAASSGKLMSPLRYQRKYNYRKQVCTPMSTKRESVFDYVIIESTSHTALSNNAQGQHVGYDRVEVLDGENGENGRDIFFFNNFEDSYFQNSYAMPINIPNVPNAMNGKLIKKVTLNSAMDTVKEERYSYAIRNTQSVNGMLTYTYLGNNICVDVCEEYVAIGYPVYAERVDLTSKSVFQFNQANKEKLITKEEFTYNTIGLISEVKTNQSDGAAKTTKFKYPFDFVTDIPVETPSVTPEALALFKLNSTNNNSSPVEIISIRNNNVISASYVEYLDKNNTTFSSDNHPVVVPVRQWKLNSSLPIAYHEITSEPTFNPSRLSTAGTWSIEKDNHYGNDPAMNFDLYDSKGNLVQFHERDNINTSFIWGYGSSYPIAMAKNAQGNQIFYESFENTSGVEFKDANGKNLAKTGNKVLLANSFTIPASFDPPAPLSDYSMSYWYHDGTKWFFSNEQPFARTISINAQKIDEVRVYPKGASMTTYTYDPLKGITSETDADNLTTHYKYDNFGRLMFIYDNEGNLVKKMEYHFMER